MVVNVVEAMKKIGFSEYEARAYVHLLKGNPATAYEVAKLSGIPSSKIYQIMSRLLERGIALELKEGKRSRYVPLDPEEFLQSYRSDLESTLAVLEQELPGQYEKQEVSYIWNISDYDSFIRLAARLCGKGKDHLLLSLWKEECALLYSSLKDAGERNVSTSIVHFGKPELRLGTMFIHPIEETLYQEKGGRGFVCVVDSREALMGTMFPGGVVEGAWSKNRGFVTLAEDYIKHDIYIMKIVGRFDNLLIERFGKKYRTLRDVFNDEEEHL